MQWRINPDRIQIPVFIHNLKNYDAHLILSAVEKRHGEISIIPQNMEKYISFKIGNIIFKDSFAFMNKSLATLIEDLKKEQLINARQYLENTVGINSRGEDEESATASDLEFIDDDTEPMHYESSKESVGKEKRRYCFIDSEEEENQVITFLFL